jgi:pyridoxal phosphate enzyme (YggS family)
MLMRFMSPSTRIMGGTPADKCRSDALFFTANASSCAMSTAIPILLAGAVRRRSRQYDGGLLPNMLIGPQISAADQVLAARLSGLRAAIAAAARAAGRTEDSITLVAVGKGHGVERLAEAAALGVRHFGESYLQEALPKLFALGERAAPGSRLTWHFIGRLQANKTRPIAEHFDWVHGLDRLRLAERLSAQRPPSLPPLNVCLEVNIGAEAAKGGATPVELPALAAAVRALPGLTLRGLMCLPPAAGGPEGSRRAFGMLRALFEQLDGGRGTLDTLSMGMSGDFREAILEGATMVRIGTALFGERARGDRAPGGRTTGGSEACEP